MPSVAGSRAQELSWSSTLQAKWLRTMKNMTSEGTTTS